MDLSAQIAQTLRTESSAPLIEFKGRWYSRGEVRAVGERLSALLAGAGLGPDVPVVLVVRNRLAHAAVILELFATGRSFSMAYAFQSAEAIARDIAGIRRAAVIADVEDWSPEAVAAAKAAGSLGIALRHEGEMVALVPGLETCLRELAKAGPAKPGIEVLSSGTTGPPKRIHIATRVLIRGVSSAILGLKPGDPVTPDIGLWPFGGIGGVCQLSACGYLGRGLSLMEKFTVPEYLELIRRNKPTSMNMTPAMIRMILDAQVPKEAFSGISVLFGGSAPLDPQVQEEFERRYGITVLWAYGATEFAGTAVGWTYDLRKQFGTGKRGSVGRALPGVTIRVVDTETGAELPRGERGYLEALIPIVKPDWIRTTDLASMDEDDFVWLHGRGDGAIIRGGFKVIPDTVAACLRRHPGVLDAAVIGLKDHRLGEVPVAAVQLKSDAGAVTPDDLKAFVRNELPVYQVPTEIRIMAVLPRTPSMKISLADLRREFESVQ
jgi:acyl-coenzyme A synthetase/AMP-(fatty) acid ligase